MRRPRLREIKYDAHRLRVERDGDRVRLITRGSKTGMTDTHQDEEATS